MTDTEQKQNIGNKPKSKWAKKQQLYDPNQKQYIFLSEEGSIKYAQISRNAYKILFFWAALGVTSGYTVYKFLPYVKITKSTSNIPRNIFIGFSLLFTHYGYKLMDRQKKIGRKLLGKDPKYSMSQEQYLQKYVAKPQVTSKNHSE